MNVFRITSLAFLFLFALATLPSCQKTSPPCIDVGTATKAVQRLAKEPWTQFAPNQLCDIWPIDPETPVCECKSCSFNEMMLAADECCKTCEIIPYLAFGYRDNSEAPGLEEIGVFVCPQSFESALRVTKTFVDAIEPPAESLVFGEPTWIVKEVNSSRRRSNRWTGAAGPVSLDTVLLRYNGRWAVELRYFECAPPEPLETITLPTGGQISLLAVDRDAPCCLSVRYFTECHFMDDCCMEVEIRNIWPIYREEAERLGKRIVDINPEDCAHGTTGYYFHRELDGEWSGNFHCWEDNGQR